MSEFIGLSVGLLILFAWIPVFTVLCGKMAEQRGLSRGAGNAIGFFLGPVGVVILCFMKKTAIEASAAIKPTPAAPPPVNPALAEYRKRRAFHDSVVRSADPSKGYRGQK